MAEISSEIEELRRKFIDHPEQFDAALAEYTRSIQSAVWMELRGRVRAIPHWRDTTGYGEFDLQPLGTSETSESGAYMAVMEVFSENPYVAEKPKEVKP